MPTKNESLNRRRQAIIDVREGISDTLSSLARGRQQGIENRRAEEAHQLDLQRARQVIEMTDRQARMAEQQQADLSQAQGAIMQSRTMGPEDVAGDVGAAAGGGIAGGAMGGSPEDRIRQRRIDLFKNTSEQVKDPKAREILNREFLAFEQQGVVREQAQKFAKKISSDLSMGGLRPLGGGEEGGGKEGEQQGSPLEDAGTQILEALELVREPQQLVGLMQSYEGIKAKLMEQEERKAFKGLMLQRVEQEIGATPDAPTQRALLGIYSRIQYGDLEEGEDIEKAIRYARAGLTPDEQRVLAWQSRAMQKGAPPAQGGMNPAGAPAQMGQPQAQAAPANGAPARARRGRSNVPTEPGKAVSYLTQLMDTAGKSTDIRDAVGELSKTFGEEQARALLAEAIRQKSEVRRMEMGG